MSAVGILALLRSWVYPGKTTLDQKCLGDASAGLSMLCPGSGTFPPLWDSPNV